jgi:hypothetical protein
MAFVGSARVAAGVLPSCQKQPLRRFEETPKIPSRSSVRQIDRFVQERLERHLQRRSRRPFRVRAARSWYEQLQRLGLRSL